MSTSSFEPQSPSSPQSYIVRFATCETRPMLRYSVMLSPVKTPWPPFIGMLVLISGDPADGTRLTPPKLMYASVPSVMTFPQETVTGSIDGNGSPSSPSTTFGPMVKPPGMSSVHVLYTFSSKTRSTTSSAPKGTDCDMFSKFGL